MRTYRLTVAEQSGEDVFYHTYFDVQAHSYESPRANRHVFRNQDGEQILMYLDSSIYSVEEIQS